MIENYITQIEIKDDIKAGEISYLSMEDSPKSPLENSSEMPTISLKPEKMAFSLERFQVSSEIPKEAERNLKEFGIDTYKMVEKTLMEELIHSRQRAIIKEMWDVSEKFQNTRDVKWWNQIFGKWNPPIKSEKLVIRLAEMTHMVAKNSRRGPANFAIISFWDKHIFEDCVKFVYINSGEIENTKGIHEVGSIMGITILVDPYAERSKMIIGRKALNSDGIVSVFSKPELEKSERFVYDLEIPKIVLSLRNRSKILSVPESNLSYMNTEITYSRSPFISHIKEKIRSIFK